MDSNLLHKLLFAQVNSGKEVEISVVGTSMNPTLYEGDTIAIKKYTDYNIGDILVYIYKDDGLLVHRLLDRRDNEYFCKGDNSFRLEDINYTDVLGKIIAVNGEPLKPCDKRLVILSLLVNRAFYKCHYDIEKTKETQIYKLYEKSILKKPAKENQ